MNPTSSPSMPASGGDFDWGAPAGDYIQPPAPTPTTDAAETPPTKRSWFSGVKARIAALIAAGAIVGGGTALAVDHSSGSSSAAGSGQTGGGPGGSGSAPGSGTGTSGRAGGITPTAYRLSGTITAVSGSTVTIKTSSGSKTYTVTSATHLQRNGSTVALSSFKVGDSVFGSTTASGGSTLNDLMTGTPGTGRGAPGGNGTAPGAGTGSSSGTSSGTSSGSSTTSGTGSTT